MNRGPFDFAPLADKALRAPAARSEPTFEPTKIEVEVEDRAWDQALPEVMALARGAAEAAARSAQGGAISILLTNAQTVKALNARFRDRDEPTNVIAFPAATNREGHLGDIALAFGVCASEAIAQGKPLADHLRHLVIHGVLHILGYDHDADGPAQRMEALERRVLEGLGVPDPYQQREHVQQHQ